MESTNVVLDTSAVVAVLLNEPSKSTLLKHTIGTELLAPYSLPIEVVNAFSSMFRRGRLSIHRAKLALATYRRIPMQLARIDFEASLELSHAFGIYAYDAYMIDYARRHRSAILSLDNGLIQVALRADVRVIEVNK